MTEAQTLHTRGCVEPGGSGSAVSSPFHLPQWSAGIDQKSGSANNYSKDNPFSPYGDYPGLNSNASLFGTPGKSFADTGELDPLSFSLSSDKFGLNSSTSSTGFAVMDEMVSKIIDDDSVFNSTPFSQPWSDVKTNAAKSTMSQDG